MKARSIDFTVFEAAAEIVSPGTAVTIRDDYPWGARGEWCIGVSGTPAAVLAFAFGLGRLDDPDHRALTDDLIADIACRTDGMELIAILPGWHFATAGDQ